MENKIKDEKLEYHLDRIKNSKSSKNKLINYKKASNRLNELRCNYNNICTKLKSLTNTNATDTETEDDLNKVINELNKLNENFNNNDDNVDIDELIEKYQKYHHYLNILTEQKDFFNNQIHLVKQEKKNIVITKINPEDII